MWEEVDESARNEAPAVSSAKEPERRSLRKDHPDNAAEWDIFLAHAGEQKQSLVQFLVDELERCGLRTFLDDFCLNAGDSSFLVMRRALRTCRAVVFVLTPESVAKKYFMQELQFALQLQEQGQAPTIIPVFFGLTVEDCKMGTAFFWKFRTTFGNPSFFVRKLQKLFCSATKKCDFYDRVERGETSKREVMDALREVCKFSGIVDRAGPYQVFQDTVQKLVGEVSAATGTITPIVTDPIVTDTVNNPDEFSFCDRFGGGRDALMMNLVVP